MPTDTCNCVLAGYGRWMLMLSNEYNDDNDDDVDDDDGYGDALH